MIFKEFSSPRPHVVVDDFFTPEQLKTLWREFKKLRSQYVVGLDGRGGEKSRYSDRKRNKLKVIEYGDPHGKPKHPIGEIFNQNAWSDELLQFLSNADSPIFDLLQHYAGDRIQISTYGNGDYYKFHSDDNRACNLTLVAFLCKEPKKFKGGDLILLHKNSRKTVPFKNNRLVIFGSNTFHSVTPVILESSRFDDMRISLQVWPTRNIHVGKNTPDVPSINGVKPKEVPYFGLSQGVWKRVESFFESVRFAEPMQGDDASEIFDVPTGALSILSGNLKYLSRKFLDGKETTIKTELMPTFHSHKRVARLSCRVSKGVNRIAFGYQLVRSPNSKVGLQLFVSLEKPGGINLEKFQDIAIDLEAKDTEHVLRSLFRQIVRESKHASGSSRARNLFQRAA